MMKTTRLKSAALFMAVAGAGAWGAASIVPDTMAFTPSDAETAPAKAEGPYHAAPGMVVTYTDGYEGGAVDDGKGTTAYNEPYDASFFVSAIVDGKAERSGRGNYYGWTIDVPKTCAAKAKAAVGRRLTISVRPDDKDPNKNKLDVAAARNAICGR